MKNKKKISNFKIVIIIDVLIVVLLIGYYVYSNNKNNNNNNTFKFKDFVYNVSNNLIFSNYDENKFKIESDSWISIVGPYIDINSELYNNREVSFKVLWESGLKIGYPSELNVNGIKIITYQKINDNERSILCYFKDDDIYAYEITLLNKDNSYDEIPLNTIIPILTNAEHSKVAKYNYTIVDYSNLLIDSDGNLRVRTN